MNQDHQDLDWQAFAYWSGDLSAEEQSNFEALLAENQEAREALARVVELSQVVVAAESLAVPSLTVRQSRRTRRIVAWTAGLLTSAAALIIGFVMGQSNSLAWLRGGQSVVSSIDPSLALAWTETREQWDELATWQASSGTDGAHDGAESTSRLEVAWDASDYEAPSWMTAAVLDEAKQDFDGSDGDPADTQSIPGESSKES